MVLHNWQLKLAMATQIEIVISIKIRTSLYETYTN